MKYITFIKLVQIIVKNKFNETTLKNYYEQRAGSRLVYIYIYIYITEAFDFLLTSPELATLLSFL